MYVRTLLAKLHPVRVTHTELDYEGSCAIDGDLLDLARIRENEEVHIYDITNGEHFSTYAIRGESGSGVISMNGAAAHKVAVGHAIVISTYGVLHQRELAEHRPVLVSCDDHNRVLRCNQDSSRQAS